MNNNCYTNNNDFIEDVDNLTIDISFVEKGVLSNNMSRSRLEKIDKDIIDIEKKITQTNKNNTRNHTIRKIKIFGRILQGAFPYVIALGLAFGMHQGLTSDIPFYQQNEVHLAQHEITIDSTGLKDDNITYISKLTDNDLKQGEAYYTSRWEKKVDGKYYRVIKKYDIDSLKVNAIKNIEDYSNLNFDSLFGNSVSTTHEMKTEDEMTANEIEDGDSFKVVYKYKDYDDVIFELQNKKENLQTTGIFFLECLMFILAVLAIREKISKYDFKRYVENIRKKHPYIELNIDNFENEKNKFMEISSIYRDIDALIELRGNNHSKVYCR